MSDFRLPRSLLPAAQVFVELEAEQRTAILKRLQDGASPHSAKDFENAIYEIGIERADANKISRLLVSLAGLATHRKESIKNVIDGIGRGLKEAVGKNNWTEPNQVQWKQNEALTIQIIETDALVRLAKTINLSYDSAHTFQDARLITEIRPVYGAKDESFESCVVLYTLRLNYTDGSSDRVLTISMDEEDVGHLMTALERVKDKTATIERILGEAGVKSVIVGRD